MSWEAWGDDDAREPPPGWWTDVTVDIVQDCIKDLVAEPVYEGGKMENGISVRFLARLTVLRGEAGLLDISDPLFKEAEAMFAEQPLSPYTELNTREQEGERRGVRLAASPGPITGQESPGEGSKPIQTGVTAGETATQQHERIRANMLAAEAWPDGTTHDEKRLRGLLARRVGVTYGDDGELQSGEPRPAIDFKRDSVDEIERKLYERALAAMTKQGLGVWSGQP